MRKRWWIAVLTLVSLVAFTSACGGSAGGASRSSDDDESDDDIPTDDDADDDAVDDDTDDDTDDDDTDDDDALSYVEIFANGQIRAMVHDVSGPLVYAADAKNNQVIVLDTADLSIVDTIAVGSQPIDLDLNPEGTRLWVATAGASAVTYVDLASKGSGTVGLDYPPASIAVGGNDRVYVPNQEEQIEIIEESTQSHIASVEWDAADKLVGAFIEIDRISDLGYIADAGSSPSTLIRFDASNDDLDVVEVNEFGSLGSNGQSLSLAPDGSTIIYPCGSGNGDGYRVDFLEAADFSHLLGTFDIGTYPKFMEYDPVGDFISGINGDPYDLRLYVMNPSDFTSLNAIYVSDWINPPDADPPRNQDLISLRANADGSALVLYAEDTYDDLEGYFYVIGRSKLL